MGAHSISPVLRSARIILICSIVSTSSGSMHLMYPAIAAARSPESLYTETTSLICPYSSSNLYPSILFTPFTPPPSRTPLRTVRQTSLLSPQSLLPTLSVSSDHPQCPHKICRRTAEADAQPQEAVDQCAYHIDASVPPHPLVPDDLVTSAGDDLPGCVMQRDQADHRRLILLLNFFHPFPSFLFFFNDPVQVPLAEKARECCIFCFPAFQACELVHFG